MMFKLMVLPVLLGYIHATWYWDISQPAF